MCALVDAGRRQGNNGLVAKELVIVVKIVQVKPDIRKAVTDGRVVLIDRMLRANPLSRAARLH